MKKEEAPLLSNANFVTVNMGCTYTHRTTHTIVCTQIPTCRHTYSATHAHIQAYTCAHIHHIHTQVHAHTHTHTHTHLTYPHIPQHTHI